ncbi:glutathione S-transferase 1-like [Galleria mellonella]|uniref:Glutathione S-transferase 1-like n=1 Tax=Galleria mellonella TaxID=7137 RepID=A0ABM3N054_GALME|nr:glutathione S-transferase 1-like [Galleria mellonella]
MVLTLYKLDASPPVRAVYMTIEALNLSDVQYIDTNLFKGEHLTEEFIQMNPQHTIPTLKEDDFVIWDSHAICGYLIAKYGKDDSLYPTEPKQRAIIDQRLHFDSGVLFPAIRGTLEPILFHGQKYIKDEDIVKINSAYTLIEKFFTAPWLAGDELTLADICCVSSISTLNEIVPINGSLYPNLLAWLERCSNEDICKKGNEPGLLQIRQMLKSKLE